MKPETDAWWIRSQNTGKNALLGIIIVVIKAVTLPYKTYGYIKSKCWTKRNS
jgi:hypothetical protein